MAESFADDPSLLGWLTARCQRNLAGNETAKAYLRDNGITDEEVWAAYRIGVGDDGLLDGLGAEDRNRLGRLGLLPRQRPNALWDGGVLLPTFDPRSTNQPVGLVKLRYGQNKHQFLTPPRGLACAADVDVAEKIILCDAPLLCLRLAQEGAEGVCLVETPEVLAPLADWLRGKKVIVTSCKKKALRKLKGALSALGVEADPALVNANLPYTPESSLTKLGLSLDLIERRTTPARPATPQLVGEITRYAQGRLAAGLGIEVLHDLEADDPEFITAHGLGFLPPDFRDALGRDTKQVLKGRQLGDTILVPASDESGAEVDGLAFFPRRFRMAPVNLLDHPQGLLLGKAATAFSEIVVTDSLRIAARLWRLGSRNVLILRDAGDAKRNAERMYRCGVRSATLVLARDAGPVSDALKAAGIEVEPGKLPRAARKERGEENPAPVAVAEPTEEEQHAEIVAAPAVEEPEAVPTPEPEPETRVATETVAPVVEEPPPPEPSEPDAPEFSAKPIFVSYDPKKEMATFTAGDAKYEVEVAVDSDSKLQVRLEKDGKVALDRFDLSVEAQRRRYAVSAAVRTAIPFETIMEHLLALLDEARRIQSEQLNPVRTPKPKVTVTEEEKAEALAFLRRPDLLDAIAADLEALGWVGEEKTKRTLYLAGVSRKLEKPLSVAMRAPSGSGKSFGMEIISALAPPEDVLHVSRLTEASLHHAEDSLRHKLLVVDESDAVTPEVAVALRVLQSRGALSQTLALRDPQTGQTVSHFGEAQGPVAVLTSTAGEIEEQTLSRCYQLSVDESPEQTARILEVQRRLRGDTAFPGRKAVIVRRHHALQRLLEIRPVLIPYASRIEFPASSLRFRREQEKFLNLIEASALLHQFQRAVANGMIVATEQDFQIARHLVQDHIARAADELSSNGRDVLAVVLEMKLAEFDIHDLKARRPGWTRYKYRAGLDELRGLELLISPKRSKPRRYEVVRGAALALAPAPVRLRPIGDSATNGEGGFANSSPVAATG
jgi:hypothetical protein